MLLIIRGKDSMSADEKMLLRLHVDHEFLHSNKIDDIKKRVFLPEKRKAPPRNKRKIITHILFDLNYMFEYNDMDFFTLIAQLQGDTPEIALTFYYFSDDEYLIGRNIEALKRMGYTSFLVAENQSDFLKALNYFIMVNRLDSSPEQRTGCVTVGVLGGCKRMGTTTQAMQMLMFLQNSGFRVGLIQWHSTPELRGYVNVIKGAKHLNQSEFVINGLRFYGKEDLKIAINDNDYLIFDFGNIEVIEDDCVMMFLETAIKIVVLGVKSNEIHCLSKILKLAQKADTKYIYSFIDQTEKDTVKRQMSERKKDTYFSDYTPSYFVYGGNDAMCSNILGVTLPQKPPQKRIVDVAKNQIEKIRSGQWENKNQKKKPSLSK